MNKKIFVRFCFLILISSVMGITQTNGQDRNISLKDKRITIQSKNESLRNIFKELIERYDIAIGFEESSLDSKHEDYVFDVNTAFFNKKCESSSIHSNTKKCQYAKYEVKDNKFTVDFENERLENVLNLIVSKMQFYKWEINDDVVNIYPNIGRNKKFEDLLNIRIKRFVVQKIRSTDKKTIYDIRDSFKFIPEFRDFLINNNLYFSSERYISPNLERELPDDMFFSDLTLRELLNKMTKIKRGGWTLRENKLVNNKRDVFVDIDI